MQLGAEIMATGGSIDAFINAVYNYPTLSDSYKYGPTRKGAQVRAHSASIRSTARRALAATAGSTMITCWFVSSARLILASVIRFMCGQRLHGRTKATSVSRAAMLSLIEHSVSSTTRAGRRDST